MSPKSTEQKRRFFFANCRRRYQRELRSELEVLSEISLSGFSPQTLLPVFTLSLGPARPKLFQTVITSLMDLALSCIEYLAL